MSDSARRKVTAGAGEPLVPDEDYAADISPELIRNIKKRLPKENAPDAKRKILSKADW